MFGVLLLVSLSMGDILYEHFGSLTWSGIGSHISKWVEHVEYTSTDLVFLSTVSILGFSGKTRLSRLWSASTRVPWYIILGVVYKGISLLVKWPPTLSYT